MTREQDQLQERHFNGMCGGDCSECWRQQEQEAQKRNYEEEVIAAARALDKEGWGERTHTLQCVGVATDFDVECNCLADTREERSDALHDALLRYQNQHTVVSREGE